MQGWRRPLKTAGSEQTNVERSSAPAGVEIRHLRYFLAVYEELHFGRAAARVHIAQPPLSQAIRRLEQELGVQLLQRTSRVVTPTEAGRVFANEARRVLACLQVAVAEARRAAGVAPPLRIGCVPNLPIEQLLRFLDALRRSHPDLPTEVTHLSAAEQLRRLRDAELDVGVFHDVGEHEGLDLERLFPGEPVAAFFAPEHRLASKEVLRPEDFRDEPLVLVPRAENPRLHDRLLEQIAEAGYRLGEPTEANGLSTRDLLLAIAEGRGVAFLPFSLLETHEARALVVRRSLEPPLTWPDTVVAIRADPPEQLRTVLEEIREIARELAATLRGDPAAGRRSSPTEHHRTGAPPSCCREFLIDSSIENRPGLVSQDSGE